MKEAQESPITDQDWEAQLSRYPYLAVTDSKSLFDALSKKTCPYSQIEDKRTAIDLSILKHEIDGVGTVRWVDGRNMIADPLTKNTGGSYLRFVMNQGRWTLNEHGFTSLMKDFEDATDCFFMISHLWQEWFGQKSFGPV